MKSVLLIDDDSTVLMTLGVGLKSMGYAVHTAKDAATAVSAVLKAKPDVVVIDVSLPAGDGFTVAYRLRRMTGSVTTPLIFMTSSGNPNLPEQAVASGATAFLKKPFTATALGEAIESVLSPDRASGQVAMSG